MNNIEQCIWSVPIKEEVNNDPDGIKGRSLSIRECYQCDGYQTLCERYLESSKNKRLNWLGLNEDYLK